MFVQENRVYTFVYNGKNRVAIVLEIDEDIKQALCWELTVGEFRRYNIKDIQSPTNVTRNLWGTSKETGKVLRFENHFFVSSGKTPDEVTEYYKQRNCTVFFGEEFTFVVSNQYLNNETYNWRSPTVATMRGTDGATDSARV